MSERAPSFGFDIGGQSIKAVVASPAGEVLANASAPTGQQTNAEALAGSLASLRDELLAAVPAASEGGAGIGIAGVLDRSGQLRGGPNLPLLVGCRIGEIVSGRLERPVVVHNDADCAAIAEGWGGAADGCDDFLMIAIGTGIGSGLVMGGKLRAGASGFGCELGHMMVLHGGRRCGCGNRGCLEAYISETAARALVEESSAPLRDRVAERRATAGGGFAESVFKLGDDGDAEAEDVANRMVDVLGAAIASAVNVLDLTTIVLGGGIAPGVLGRMTRLREAAAASLFARPVDDLIMKAASRGPLAGAIGAARLGMLSLRSP
ncbi:MAG: ROK family protein [Candidatus Binatia bacterium]